MKSGLYTLNYEVYGTNHGSSIAKSINFNNAYGGDYQANSVGWTKINEIIPTSQLKKELTIFSLIIVLKIVRLR